MSRSAYSRQEYREIGKGIAERLIYFDKVANIKNEKLKAALNIKYFDQVPHADIKNGQIEKIKDIDLSNFGIDDIDDLMYAISLERLVLDYNNIEDISVLSNLNKIKTLSLRGNNIKNFDVLSELYNLEDLDIASNSFSELIFTKPKKNLKKVDISNNPITDLSSLCKLENLKQMIF